MEEPRSLPGDGGAVDAARPGGHVAARAKGPDGRGIQVVDIEAADHVALERSRDLVAIDDALQALAEHDPRKAQIVELRFFGGSTWTRLRR